MGCLSGCISICLDIHWPSKCANHQPLRPDVVLGLTNGILKNLCSLDLEFELSTLILKFWSITLFGALSLYSPFVVLFRLTLDFHE